MDKANAAASVNHKVVVMANAAALHGATSHAAMTVAPVSNVLQQRNNSHAARAIVPHARKENARPARKVSVQRVHNKATVSSVRARKVANVAKANAMVVRNASHAKGNKPAHNKVSVVNSVQSRSNKLGSRTTPH